MAVIQNIPFNLFGEYVGLGLQLEYFQINYIACFYRYLFKNFNGFG